MSSSSSAMAIATDTYNPFQQQKLRVATVDHIHYLDINDIVRVQSFSNYSKIFLSSGKTLLVAKVLAHFEEMLSGFHFVRIHRTHLVNLHCIRQYNRGNERNIDLHNDEVLPVARSKKSILQKEMKLISIYSV